MHRTNRSRRRAIRYIAVLTCLMSLMAFAPQPSLAATYEAVSGFSITSNPSGPWSYGWQAVLGGAFTPNSATDNNASVPGIEWWQGPDYCGPNTTPPAGGLFPVVAANGTGATLYHSRGISQPATMLNLIPGCSGKFSVVRWTAPTTGWVSVTGLFQGIDTRGTTTDVHVLRNSATLLNANINSFGDQAAFSFTHYLAAGDVLDFAVGLGADGAFWNDATGLAVTITTPVYAVCPLYDPAKAVQSGAVYPIKIRLCDPAGNDMSSPNITLHATSVSQTSTGTSRPVEDAGNANPNNDFRFDPALGGAGGYIFNLSTRGLPPGAHSLNFTVTGAGPLVFGAPFLVK